MRALSAGASYILVGGSFVTKKENPNDIDLVLVFPSYDLVPGFNQSVLVADIELDILVCSSQDEKTVTAFANLLAFDKSENKRGLAKVKVNVDDQKKIKIYQIDGNEYEFVKKAYSDKKLVSRANKKGVLVTIHGILSHGTWNYRFFRSLLEKTDATAVKTIELNATTARTYADKAAACSKTNSWKHSVAIVDQGGNLIYFHRDDSATIGSVEMAIAKAANSWRVPTKIWAEWSKREE